MAKTGNPATPAMNAAKMMPPGPESDCEKMEVMNTQLRGDLASDPESASIRGAFGEKATTVAHGSLSGGGVLGATSRLLPSRYDNRVAKGIWKEKDKKKRRAMKKSGASNVCPESKFKYGKGFRPHQSHCESKMLEEMFGPPSKPPTGQTLTLNINWQTAAGPKKEPCEACRELLCHAQKNCELKIKICQENPKSPPEPLDCN
jgi:hypothetical protein